MLSSMNLGGLLSSQNPSALELFARDYLAEAVIDELELDPDDEPSLPGTLSKRWRSETACESCEQLHGGLNPFAAVRSASLQQPGGRDTRATAAPRLLGQVETPLRRHSG